MYRGVNGHDDFTDLAESNRSRKLASAGQDKMKDLIKCSDMTRNDKSLP